MNRARRRPQSGRTGGGNDRDPEERQPYRPQPKKGAHPAVVVVTLVLLVGTVSMFAFSYINRPTEPVKVIEESTNDKEYRAIQKDIQRSNSLAREVVQNRNDWAAKEFSRKWQKAMDFSSATQQKLREMLAEVRNEDGTLPPEYSGYNSDFTRIQTIIGDLAKVAPMFTDDEE